MATSPRWKELLEGMLTNEDNKGYPDTKNAVLATCTSDGSPRARYIVHRAIMAPESKDGRVLIQSTTDIRSGKVDEIGEESNKCELVYWTAPTGEQLRVRGIVSLYHPSLPVPEALKNVSGFDWASTREQAFERMSHSLRASFARPAPGSKDDLDKADSWPTRLSSSSEIKEDESKTNDGRSAKQEQEAIDKAFSNFALLIVEPTAADYVNLKITPNERYLWQREGDDKWQEEAVAP